MKVVLFCGGFGMRLREHSESVPKPMVKIGYRPILWHVMKYYAHFGHRDFILCLGWKGHVIKDYFLNYDECLSNDFVLAAGGHDVRLLHRDIDDWRITFVDTGSGACIGQRLRAVQPHLAGEPTFLANYADGLTDLPLPELIDFHRQQDALATFLSVKPKQSFHSVVADPRGRVRKLEAISQADVWMNGGYFVLDAQIFDYLREGEELVEAPFRRLIARQRLATLRYDGFWCCMDTYKEMQTLDDMYSRGETPWEVWKRSGGVVCPSCSAPPPAVPSAIT
jgi:glucose-1-phosphate cytidylyltransferase